MMASLRQVSSTERTAIRDTSAQDLVLDASHALKGRQRLLLGGIAASALLVLAAALIAKNWITTAIVVPRERVRIAEVTQGRFVRDVAAEGVIVARDSPTLYASTVGTVSFAVHAGDTVTKDQVLGSLDSPTLRNEQQRERATLDALNVALERHAIEVRRQILQNQQTSDLAAVQTHAAEREFKRIEAAWQSGVMAEKEVARARDEMDSATLKLRHAIENARLQNESLEFELQAKRLERDRQKFVVDNLSRRVAELEVRSPVSGVVGNLIVGHKANVAENAPLMTVVDLSAFEIEFRVPESAAKDLAMGMNAEIAFNGKTYAGTIAAISPEVQRSEVIGRVRFANDIPKGLRQNQRVNLRVVLDARDRVLKVERGGFVDAGNVAYVVVDELAMRRSIKIGAMSVAEVEILEGLKPGERIVVSSVGDFHDAPQVRLSN